MVEAREDQSQPYQLFILGVCIYALVALAAETFFHMDRRVQQILSHADTGVCVLFLLDFAINLVRSGNRWRYLYTWGWIDLASSIPAVQVLRWGRLARVVRIFRLLRGIRSARMLAGYILDRRAEGAFLAAALLSILFVVFGSIMVLQFEISPDSNIKTGEDALWWAFATITTVGYGDRYPVTSGGRVVAALLMTAGVGLFGTFAGFVASSFLEPSEKKQAGELDEIRAELHRLRRSIESSDEARKNAE